VWEELEQVGLKSYYKDDAVFIINDDCRKVLPLIPSGYIDLCLTDPPYGMRFRSNHRQTKHDFIVGDDHLPLDLINIAISKALRASYIFCNWNNLSRMPPPKSVLVWIKNNWSMGDLRHEHGRQWEAICFYPAAQHEFINRIPDVITTARTNNNKHPTEKPVSLMKKLIQCNVGNTILDPFMGSGTTLVAAQALGRRCIGIEIEERYCQVAVERLRQLSLPLTIPMSHDKLNIVKQGGLFNGLSTDRGD